jgi:hypothetical protein
VRASVSIPIDRIKFPELFFGFVAPIGADLGSTLAAFKAYFVERKYNVVEIEVTDIFSWLAGYYPPASPLKRTPLLERYKSNIDYGNQLRMELGDHVLAGTTGLLKDERDQIQKHVIDIK